MSPQTCLRIIAVFFLSIGGIFLWQPTSNWSQQVANLFSGHGDKGLLIVAFLDVGQGDAIYIETPEGVQALIDGGPDSTVLRELPKVMPFWDRSLDVVLATHPDKDHIGGLVDVLTRYAVDTIVRTDNRSDTAVSSAFVLVSSEEEAVLHETQAGDVIELGASTTLTILSPTGDAADWESNNSSIVAKLSYEEVNFMLTGDAGIGIEEYLVSEYGEALDSEVLKLGHHGSRTSTAERFLQAVSPEYAVVSAGKDNRYGHPHEEVIERVAEYGSKLMSTAEQGTIIFKSDGERVWVE
jgi:competence protein ComEC